MPIQQRNDIAKQRHAANLLVLFLLGKLLIREHLLQVLPDGVFDKQCLRILGQRCHAAPVQRDPAAVWLVRTGQQAERRRLSRAIAA